MRRSGSRVSIPNACRRTVPTKHSASVKSLYSLGQPEKAIGHEPQIDLCVAFEQPPALSASGTDPRARYSIKMQRSWKKKMIPPLRGGDFQGIAGLSSDDSLLAENQRRLSGAAQNQASAIAHRGLEVKLQFSTSGRGRNIFLDIPFYRSGVYAQVHGPSRGHQPSRDPSRAPTSLLSHEVLLKQTL